MATTEVTNNIGLDAFKDSKGHVNWQGVWSDLKSRVNALGYKSTYGDKGCIAYSTYEKALKREPSGSDYGWMTGCCAKIIDNYGNPATFAVICDGEPKKNYNSARIGLGLRGGHIKVEEHYFEVKQKTDGTEEDNISTYVETIRTADMEFYYSRPAFNNVYDTSEANGLVKAPKNNLSDILKYFAIACLSLCLSNP